MSVVARRRDVPEVGCRRRPLLVVAIVCATTSFALRPSSRSCQSRASCLPPADCGGAPSTTSVQKRWA